MLLGSSVVRVLARCARGPEFETRSGRVSFSSPVTLMAAKQFGFVFSDLDV